MKMIDVLPNALLGNSIFSKMLEPPWIDVMDNSILDVSYILENGQRTPSTITLHFMENGEINETALANLILARFKTQWQHLADILKIKYVAIENYNMEENTTYTANQKGVDKIVNTDVITNNGRTDSDYTTTNNLSDKLTDETITDGTVNDDIKNNRYAFNSALAVPINEDNKKNISNLKTNTDTTKNLTGTVANNGSDVSNSTINGDTTANKNTENDTKTTNLLTRKGNIGVTTTQQMLSQELDFWKWSFTNTIFSDVNSLLTLSVYEN